MSLSALKKLHSRLSNWYAQAYVAYTILKIETCMLIVRKIILTSRHRLHRVDSVAFCSFVLSALFSILLQCNNNEIRPGKHIGVCISVANNRLFVGSIPKSKTKEQIVEEFAKVTGESAPPFTSSFLHFNVAYFLSVGLF